MKFWRLLGQGQFRQAWEILSRRPDSEHEQALIRVVITALLFFYLYWSSCARDGRLNPGEVILLWICGLYHLFSLGLFVLITIGSAGKSPFRRSLGIVGDLCLTAYGISVVGDGGARCTSSCCG